jgi:hypothetical protein
VAQPPDITLRRSLAAVLMRWARRLEADGEPRAPADAEPSEQTAPIEPAAAAPVSQAPQHWLDRLRPGAHRLSVRVAPGSAPEPEDAKREHASAEPARADWRQAVRERARELGFLRKRTSLRVVPDSPPQGQQSDHASPQAGTSRVLAPTPARQQPERHVMLAPDTSPHSRQVSLKKSSEASDAGEGNPAPREPGIFAATRRPARRRPSPLRPIDGPDELSTVGTTASPRPPSASVNPVPSRGILAAAPSSRIDTPRAGSTHAPGDPAVRAARDRMTASGIDHEDRVSKSLDNAAPPPHKPHAAQASKREPALFAAPARRTERQAAWPAPDQSSTQKPARAKPRDAAGWPTLPDEHAPTDGDWPTLPDELAALEKDEGGGGAASADAQRLQFLFAEQRGEPWNA